MHTTQEGAVYVPPAAEVLVYDVDGNLTQDGRWDYTWDGENRLIAMQTTAAAVTDGVPNTRLEFTYDSQSRRTMKRVFQANEEGILILRNTLVFVYDGWNLIAEFSMNPHTSSFNLHTSYEWGLDLSGSTTGAGGVGGLLVERSHSPSSVTTHAPTYDGNGNITALINLANGQPEAKYEYNAFGQTLTAEGGTVAAENRFQFSTKYEDEETTLLYYGYRYLSMDLGRWLSRDPIGERGGINLYGMVGNQVTTFSDLLGMLEVIVNKANREEVQVDWVMFDGSKETLMGGFCRQDATSFVSVPSTPNKAGCYVIVASITQEVFGIFLNASKRRSMELGTDQEILEHELMHVDGFGQRLDTVASQFVAEKDTFKTRTEALAEQARLEPLIAKAIRDALLAENQHFIDDAYDTPRESTPYPPTKQPKIPPKQSR